MCIAGMGLYRVDESRKVEKLTAETNRSPLSIIDDSRIRMPDDLDIAPDGKVYFSEATIRYGFEEWVVDALEGRGNGRIIRYDPATGATRTVVRNLLFANGMCMAHDNRSVLFAETWGCTIKRYWLAGPQKGKIEVVIPNLAGISRQHQSRFARDLLGGALGHADAELRSRDDHAGVPAAHGAAGRRRRMAVPQRQRRLRGAFRRRRRASSNRCGICTASTIPSDHFDARASRLSLSRRRHQQSPRPHQARRRRSGLDRRQHPIGGNADEPVRQGDRPMAGTRRRRRSRCRRWTAPSDPTIAWTRPRRSSRRRRPTAWLSPRKARSSRRERSLFQRRQSRRRTRRFLRCGDQRLGGLAGRRRGRRP